MKPTALTVPPLPLEIEDRRFLELFHRLRPLGGMLSDDELQCLHSASQTRVVPGQAPMRCEPMSLRWRQRLWMPVFQFDPGDWRLSPDVGLVVAELSAVMQGFDLIEWFLTPNAWLRNHRPVDVVRQARPLVQHAAQVERFLLSF